MTIYYPEGTPTLGNIKVVAAVAVADETAPKLATEVKAASSVELSMALYPAGWNPGATVNKGTKPPRLGSTTQQEQFNRTTYTLASLQYVYDPQADDTDPNNAAKAMLTEGSEVYILEGRGISAEEGDFAVGTRTRSHHVRLGPQIPQGDTTDENGEFYMLQDITYVGSGPIDGVVVA